MTFRQPSAPTALITHPACLAHEPPAGHPENASRLRAVLDALSGDDFRALKRTRAPRATLDMLARVHDRDFIQTLLASLPTSGLAMIDSDTGVSSGSREAVLRATGANVHAVDLVMSGEVQNAFCAVRPPGHHGGPARAMGFCLFNNICVGAAHARAVFGLERIGIIDFDVHHGNGTEAWIGTDKAYFYGSTHQASLFPGTGREAGGLHIHNHPLAAGSGSAAFRGAFKAILDELTQFSPDFIFISAGFDGHRDDHMAQLKLEDADYAWATEEVCKIAAKTCQGRVVSTLEGGYDLPSLVRSVRAHIQVLMAA